MLGPWFNSLVQFRSDWKDPFATTSLFAPPWLGCSTSCLWLKRRYQHWTRLGLPQPRPVLGLGNLADLVWARKSAGMVYDEIYRQFPDSDAVGFYEFLTPKLLLRDPRLIQRVLISDFASFHDNEMYTLTRLDSYMELFPFLARGDSWKTARTAFSSGLTSIKLKNIYKCMEETVALLKTYLEERSGPSIETKELASLFILTNVSNSVYGVANNCFTDPDSHFRRMADMLTKQYWSRSWMVLLIFFLPSIRDFLGFGWIPNNASKYLEHMMKHVAHDRLKNNIRRNDYLQYYLDQKTAEEDIIYQVISHGKSFLSAGIETTSLPSSNTLYELAKHQDVQETLHRELKEAFGGKPILDYNTLMSLPYLDKVVQESLRMYPVFYSQWKICTKTTELEINGRIVQIEPGTALKIPTYSIFHDPNHFPQPEAFNPERFDEVSKSGRPPCTYIPFGEGPRMCPGMKLALLQVKLFTATIIHLYKVLSTDRTPSRVTFSPSSFLVVPAQEQWVRLERRE